MRRLLIYLGLFSLSLNLYAETAQQNKDLKIRGFESNSLQIIANEYQNRPFMLVLWSLECGACFGELELLSEYLKRYPEASVVFLSTDAPDVQPQVRQVLNKYELQDQDHWQFANDHMAALRYAVDPQWHGELPRTYFYPSGNTEYHRQAASGVLDKAILDCWFDEHHCSMAHDHLSKDTHPNSTHH